MFENREGSRMSRFFFHVNNDSTFKEEGENYPNLETAMLMPLRLPVSLQKKRAMRALRSR
jgi:hypothetical protein